ncbi:outer membrane protein [Sphingobium yanoikuyae]|uniref:Opacity protein n=1 Tax=Sphingobium yanoikuyae TaxID=13690 RepID=A0A291MXV8_SPHYA|nr:porin family protein [Sphingobium yanoikuyae]ATI79984.1 opacity protein [Sphingobium yanoikuyae]
MYQRIFAAVAAMSAIGFSVPAFAQADEPFVGPRVTVIGGWDRIDHDGENGSGFVYGGNAGYDIAIGNVRLAPEVEVTGTTQKSCFAETAGRRCERADRDFYAGGRIGYVVTPSVLLYGKAGYTNGRFTDRFTPATGSTAVAFDRRDNRSGFRLGAGVEYALTQNFFVTGEYRYSNYSADFSRNQIIGGVGFRF